MTVDPAQAFGKNLCDPAVQAALIADAQEKLNGRADTGGGGTSTPPPPSEEPPPPLGERGEPPELVPPGEGEEDVTGCAVDTWASMVNQSVLQARREMLVNQRVVTKPDSVLAYGCFNMYLETAKQADYIFSGTERWANASVPLMNGDTATIAVSMGPDSLDYALYTVVFLAHRKYLEANFNHVYLGGTSQGIGLNTAVVNNPNDVSCDIMARVWQQAKCRNFGGIEAFYTFEDLVIFDPRKFPDDMVCTDSGITLEMISIARNYQHASVEFSKVQTHLDYMLPGGAQGEDSPDSEDADGTNEGGEDGEEVICMPPIPTGATVVRNFAPKGQKIADIIQYPDAVCSNAGCSYQVELPSGDGKCLPEPLERGEANIFDDPNMGP